MYQDLNFVKDRQWAYDILNVLLLLDYYSSSFNTMITVRVVISGHGAAAASGPGAPPSGGRGQN